MHLCANFAHTHADTHPIKKTKQKHTDIRKDRFRWNFPGLSLARLHKHGLHLPKLPPGYVFREKEQVMGGSETPTRVDKTSQITTMPPENLNKQHSTYLVAACVFEISHD